MDNFKIIYRILSYLEEAMDYEAPDMNCISPAGLRMTRQRWNAIMAMLREEDLIDGLTVKKFAGGAITVSGTRPRITLRGLEYLAENPCMKRWATGNRRPFSMLSHKPV